MRHSSAFSGFLAVPALTLSIIALTGCDPKSTDLPASAECVGDDCAPTVQVHEVTSEQAVEVTETFATSGSPPTFTSGNTHSVDEGVTAVVTVTTTDVDPGDSSTFSIVGGQMRANSTSTARRVC